MSASKMQKLEGSKHPETLRLGLELIDIDMTSTIQLLRCMLLAFVSTTFNIFLRCVAFHIMYPQSD